MVRFLVQMLLLLLAALGTTQGTTRPVERGMVPGASSHDGRLETVSIEMLLKELKDKDRRGVPSGFMEGQVRKAGPTVQHS